jgi:hypothetical protein
MLTGMCDVIVCDESARFASASSEVDGLADRLATLPGLR